MINRQTQHRLVPKNHSMALPRYILSYDAETNREPIVTNRLDSGHNFRLACGLSCRLRSGQPVNAKRHRFSTISSVWSAIRKLSGMNYTTWVIGHNILFDLRVSGFKSEYAQGKMAIEWPRSKRKREDNNEDNPHCYGLVAIKSPPTIVACKIAETQGRVVFVDLMNWFPVALSKLGEACGCPKLKMPEWTDSNEAWFEYCERDTEIVLRTFLSLIDWIKDNDFGMFRYTAPSQAMAAYRHKFMDKNIYTHENTEVKQIERNSYVGGRTEAWKLGIIDEPVWQLDVSALFPSVMRENRYPVCLDRYEIRGDYGTELPDISWADSIAEIMLYTEKPLYPIRRNGYIVYPVGHLRTTLAGPELKLAAESGCIKAIKSWAEYRTDDIFSKWVNSLWHMRQEYEQAGNELLAQFTKRLMNALYGKFGQRAPDWVNCPNIKCALPWDCWTVYGPEPGRKREYRSFGWQVQEYVGKVEKDGTFPAISSFVASYGRVRMNGLREIAGQENVYYQGVDCLLVNKMGYGKLDTGGEIAPAQLGKLRLQADMQRCEIHGVSDYEIGERIIVAGRSRDWGRDENGQVIQRKFLTRQNLFNGTIDSTVIETELPWVRHGEYCKGTLATDGSVTPLVIDERDKEFILCR